eukprot:TRINITY_DN12449_c0_g1_i1.p1 TRINITY_DN12449_c0_g1~~TRINITY_DN12449_c0_g1_i1.p1  ORF type:complete len:199 (-),score=23.38 TRINITY_DN12449_c0_g1_i1:114-710(-)
MSDGNSKTHVVVGPLSHTKGAKKKDKKTIKKGKETKVVILGLDNAGKTASLYFLTMGEVISEYMKTVDANVEKVKVGKFHLEMFDLGGVASLRKLWKQYYTPPPQVIIWVVDLSNRDRIRESHDALRSVNNELADSSKPPLLVVIGAKSDLDDCVPIQSLVSDLALSSLASFESIYVQACSTVSKTGYSDVLDWVCAQ